MYRHFGKDWANVLDFSDKMLIEMYNHSSYGTPVSKNNGFYVGASWLDVNVSMWNEDIAKGHLRRSDLYEDDSYPHWWLDKVLK